MICYIEEIKSVGLFDHEQKVILLTAMSSMKALHLFEKNTLKCEGCKALTEESVYADDYSTKLNIIAIVCEKVSVR